MISMRGQSDRARGQIVACGDTRVDGGDTPRTRIRARRRGSRPPIARSQFGVDSVDPRCYKNVLTGTFQAPPGPHLAAPCAAISAARTNDPKGPFTEIIVPSQPQRLQVEWVAIDRLSPNPANPRHNDDAVPHVAASLRRFGFQQPIVAKRSGEVLAGHTRLKAARQLGLAEVPVAWFDGSDLDATAYAIADNRTHEFASWNELALAQILDELRKEDALAGVGYSPDDIDALLTELEAGAGGPCGGPVDDPGPQDPPETPTSRAGDLWIVGDHRLLCGDSTKPDDVERVLGGERSVILSTDPPYCVNYTGADRPVGEDGKPSGKDWSHVYREVDIKDLGEFLDGVLSACLPHVAEDAPVYMWHAHVQQPTIAAVFERHGLLLHQVVVWVKPCAVFGHSYFRWRHEPCAFGWRKGNKPKHGTAQLDTVWEVDWEGKARVVGNTHPTQKPLRLFEIPMELHTRAGDIVLEPFSGSGSQLLAAERLGRRCRAIEVSPAFVDADIVRFEKATGKKVVLDGDGRTFEVVAKERGAVDPPRAASNSDGGGPADPKVRRKPRVKGGAASGGPR